ncbi:MULTISPECIES: hypothetical protein [Kitasatospora]|uniref:Uncharacterized protein n=1 Tax=Kitasatospora cathayae TaxID=3004092 RepID=A0ABY7QE91_9ACTN|nr:hypothetical protein [Kitasatospora sp. HUAS 3-15]WBP90411.1 hypothetical protein O1G21_34170 [Kitasatospora sp. HUAS 3-15]
MQVVIGFVLGCLVTAATLRIQAGAAARLAQSAADRAAKAAVDAQVAAESTRVMTNRVVELARAVQPPTRTALLGSVHAGLAQLEQRKRAAEPRDAVPWDAAL